MIRVRLLKGLLVVVPVVLLVVFLRVIAEEVRRAGVPDGYRVVVEDDRWVVYGRPGAEGHEEAMRAIDAFERAFVGTFAEPFSLTLRDEPVVLYVFERREEFDAFAENRLSRHASQIAGYYRPADRSMVAYGRSQESLLGTLRHEMVHMLLDMQVAGAQHEWSRWLNEGLAQCFETGLVVDGRVLPAPPSARLRAAWAERRSAGTVPRVADFIRDEVGFERDMHFHYVYAEILVGYLLDRHRERFFEYFERERARGPVDPRELTARFGDDLRPELDAWLASFER